jgi:hypothetical protein
VALRAQGSGREKKKREKKTENSDANPKHWLKGRKRMLRGNGTEKQ